MYQVEKLRADDHDALLDFLDTSFGYTREKGFLSLLPAMWRRTDEWMEKNIAIKENGKIIAAMGIYPLTVHVADKVLRFATTGNIAVAREHREKGLMRLLMTAADGELARLGCDGARLGGERLRYQRYGFDYVGYDRTYILTEKNARTQDTAGILFSPPVTTDTAAMQFVSSLCAMGDYYAERGVGQDLIDTMSAFHARPYIATRNGRPIGALSVWPDGRRAVESYATDAETHFTMLCAWVKEKGVPDLHFSRPAWDEMNRIAGQVCEEMQIRHVTQCKILAWDRVIDAWIGMKRKTEGLPQITPFVIGIEGYGCVELDRDGCRRVDKAPCLTLDPLRATQFFFGHGRPDLVCPLPQEQAFAIRALLPLPFWWNYQDRV